MQFRPRQLFIVAAAIPVLVALIAPITGNAVPKFGPVSNVEKLAERIDKLQRHIDEFGTVVAKSPDVWGQSRLLKHRGEFETQMAAELTTFAFNLNGFESTSDSSFLASALAIGSQIGTPPSILGSTPAGATTTSNVTNLTMDLIPDSGDVNGTTNQNLVARTNRTGAPFATFQTPGAANPPATSITIEPTVRLDQYKRYLDHLHALRRINEGDDTADSPGYSLNLVRIPISVIPGKKTRFGYGAEMTITMKSYLSDETLPTAFRDLVVNGTADRITPSILGMADRAPIIVLRKALGNYYAAISKPEFDRTAEGDPYCDAFRMSLIEVIDRLYHADKSDPTYLINDSKGYLQKYVSSSILDHVHELVVLLTAKHFKQRLDQGKITLEVLDNEVKNGNRGAMMFQKYLTDPNQQDVTSENSENSEREVYRTAKSILEQIISSARLENAGGTQPRFQVAIPVTHQDAVNGSTLVRPSLDVFSHQADSIEEIPLDGLDYLEPGMRGLNYQDVKGFIRKELNAAYEMLLQPGAASLWRHCGPELAQAIREVRREIPPGTRRKHISPTEAIAKKRALFFEDIIALFPEAEDTTTVNLAWHIIVESALLNEHLVADMKKIASSKGCNCLSAGWMQFYGPEPTPEARFAFNQYVECRWPIHVFALDPVTDDQNIGTVFSRRRELQLVLALAASRSRFGVQSLSRMVRRMEYDLETIELNRTAIGFSHGDDTFGWRFFPRVQAPPVPGNLQAAAETLIGGANRERDLAHRKMEPAMRECEAIVVMPSFVPYVSVDFRSNWFRLADCNWRLQRAGHREMDLRNAVDASKEIVALKTAAQACFKDADKYRAGEVDRLLRAVDQLDKQLPLQTSHIQMPYENTLGGFEMFNTGVSDLAPELHGWYGAPGISVTAATTTSAALAQAADRVARAQADYTIALAKDPEAAKALVAPLKALVDAYNLAQATAGQAGLSPRSGTTLYLVGKNFSVLTNYVIAGGARLEPGAWKVINRQVIQVEIPANVNTVQVRGKTFVDIHIATPYGATSHLHIPIADDSSTVADKLSKATNDILGAATVAATAAAKKELTPVTQQFTATKFAFVKPGNRIANITRRANGGIETFNQSQIDGAFDLKIANVGDSAFMDDFKTCQSAWFVQLEMEDGTTRDLTDPVKKGNKFRIGALDHSFKDGLIDVKTGTGENGEALIPKLTGRLTGGVNDDEKVKFVRLIGYLRFQGPKDATTMERNDPLPIIKLDPVTIQLLVDKK